MISNEREFWTVGYSEWGRWQVRRAPVDDPTDYTLEEDLGPELLAAYLEAEGDFVYLPGEEHLSLITDGLPWLFALTTSNKLYVKRVRENINNSILLDTGVLQASVCRGWKSNKYGVDAGLLVVYRKQTGVYLRAYYQVAGVYTWDAVQIIYAGHADHVEIKRLNDFRLGISIDNRLYISDRYYIGGTSKTEYFYTDATLDFFVLSMTQPDGPHDDLQIVRVELKNKIEFWVTANYPFYSCDQSSFWINDLTLTTNVAQGQGIDWWKIEDGYLKIRMLQPLLTDLAYMSFRIRGLNRIRFERTPQSRPICPQIDIIYEAPPVQYEEQFNIQIATSLQLTMREQRKLNAYNEEEFLIGVSVPNVVFNTVLMGQLTGYTNEQFYVDIQTELHPITIELVGDKPI